MNVAVPNASWLPAHVPADLAWDHDVIKFASGFDDPFIGLADHLHAGPDIVYARGTLRSEPGWLLTRHAHIEEAHLRPDLFSSDNWAQTRELLGVDWAMNPLEIDRPAHTAYRMILQPWFTPRAITALEPMVRQVCRELIAKLEDRDGCEFISEFAQLFPSYIFLSLMGMPRERLPEFLAWEEMFFRAKDNAERAAGLGAIGDYLAEFTAEKRANPGDDLVSAIVTAKIDGRPLNHGEVMGMTMNLYAGGLDTVLSSLGWYFRYLAGDPELQARLRADPQDIPAAVEEFLRAFGITSDRRIVAQDCEFHGVVMKKGDWVALPTGLAGRDPREWPNPHVIDIDRRPRHVTLARGVHVCLGMHLARREIKIVLEEFLSRFSNIRTPEGEKALWHLEGVWGVHHLPLIWDRDPA